MTPSGDCLTQDGVPVPCPVEIQGFCPEGQYYSRRDKKCRSLCQPDEYYTQLSGCEQADCIVQNADEFVAGPNTFHADGFLRNSINDTYQYCFKCAMIPIRMSPPEPDGFILHNTEPGEVQLACSPSFTELNQHQLIEVNSTEVVLYSNSEGSTVALHKEAVLYENGTYFLNSSAPDNGIRCRFTHVPAKAVAESTEERVIVRQNLGLSVYPFPLYVKNKDGSFGVCFEQPDKERLDQ